MKFRQNRHFSPNSATFRAPSSWVNLFALIISSTALAKFRQNRHFRQIRQHFGALLAGLIYSLLSFRQQPWRNLAKIAIFATACISGHISASWEVVILWVREIPVDGEYRWSIISPYLSTQFKYIYFIYSLVFFTNYRYITISQSNQLPDGLIAQLVEHCTGIAEVMGSNPVQALMFFSCFFRALKKLSPSF